jgi:hypothetical protein
MADKKAEPLHGYLLSEQGFHELSAISAQLRLMAEITYGFAHEGNYSGHLLIRREVMGWYFEELGVLIDEVLSALTPANNDFSPPLH